MTALMVGGDAQGHVLHIPLNVDTFRVGKSGPTATIYTRRALPAGVIVDDRDQWSHVDSLFTAPDVELVVWQLLHDVYPDPATFAAHAEAEIMRGRVRHEPLTPVWRENIGPPDSRPVSRWRWFALAADADQ